jgi:hypothetical protein
VPCRRDDHLGTLSIATGSGGAFHSARTFEDGMSIDSPPLPGNSRSCLLEWLVPMTFILDSDHCRMNSSTGASISIEMLRWRGVESRSAGHWPYAAQMFWARGKHWVRATGDIGTADQLVRRQKYQMSHTVTFHSRMQGNAHESRRFARFFL